MTGQERITNLLGCLYSGQSIRIKDIIKKYNVTERTAYRDMDKIRKMVEGDEVTEVTLDLNPNTKRYRLSGIERLSLEEVVAFLKIIVSSRAFSQSEMQHVTSHLLNTLSDSDQNMARQIISGELIDYIPLQKNKDMLPLIREFIEHINQHKELSYDYLRNDGKSVTRNNTPTALYFSDFYFYIMFYVDGRRKPTPYRLDNIKNIKIIKNEKQGVVKTDIINSQFYRNKSHHMYYSGKEKTFQFHYWGNTEAALNRLPGSKILEKHQDYVLIQAEAIDNGVMVWLLSQGDKVKVISPLSMVNEIKTNIQNMLNNYE